MRLRCLLLMWLVSCGSGHNTRMCVADDQCIQAGINGFCVASSVDHTHRWCAFPDVGCASHLKYGILAGDGLEEMCVTPIDGGTIDATLDDGAAIDGPLIADGGIVDAAPGHPPVTSGQFADLVLGQPDFTTGTVNTGGESDISMKVPAGVSIQGTSLLVGDGGNARVLAWAGLPTVSRQGATFLIGQPSFTMHTSSTSQTLLSQGNTYVVADAMRVFVSDRQNSRILIFTPTPTTTGAAATFVVGAANFTTSTGGTTASLLNHPAGVWSDGTRLIVADQSNSRVLIYDPIPTSNGASASIVLGQADFTTATVTSPPTASRWLFHAMSTSTARDCSSSTAATTASWCGTASRQRMTLPPTM